ncbi:MAG TPA: N-6 DNA methylase [Geobacteraceae bacterium]
MKLMIDKIEERRIALQAELDAGKTQAERNRLGQFATPTSLADEILKYASRIIPPDEKVSFLDPAIGTGAFYSALLKVFPERRIEKALGFEIDPHYGEPAKLLWKETNLSLRLADFTHEEPTGRFNLVICNPPYVRHHHLQNGNKFRLQSHTRKASGMKLSGLAGLYCHFLGLTHAWMADGGVAGWLIPSEFMDVNYGLEVKRYLLERVTLLRIHRFDPNDVQFSDALVSSAVVWFRKAPPPAEQGVLFTLGGTLLEPALSRSVPSGELAHEAKWTRFPLADVRAKTTAPRLVDFFQIKRGIATGDNKFFILSEEEAAAQGIPPEVLKPILPSPRYLPEDEVKADRDGNPMIGRRLFLIDTRLPESDIKERFPKLWTYLEKGEEQGLSARYLCSHRSPWYSQENRPPAPIVCTYIGRGDTKRGRPFRFILNESRATIANVYLAMYPTAPLARAMKDDKTLMRKVWRVLNSIAVDQLLSEGRVYGGGLFKLEPKELANVDATAIAALIPDLRHDGRAEQLKMFG